MTRSTLVIIISAWLAAKVVAADYPLPSLNAAPSKEGSTLRIRNAGPKPLTALVIEMVGYPGNRFGMVQDEIDGKPIPAGGEREYRTDAKMPGTVPEYLQVTAAIYADGSTLGARDTVAQILTNRRHKLRGIRAVLARMAGRRETEAAAAIADLDGWKSSLEPELRFVANLVTIQLKDLSVAEVLEDLRRRERILAESKPELLRE